MNKIICYLNSNYIDIKKNNKIYHIISDSIINGDIKNSKLFIKDIKNKKILSNIFTNNIEIYLNKNIEEKDLLYYKNIFEDLNCNKIDICSTSNKLKNDTLIECYPIYILYHNDNYIFLDNYILEYYLSINDINKLKIISLNKLKDNKNCKYYYYNNPTSYFIN